MINGEKKLKKKKKKKLEQNRKRETKKKIKFFSRKGAHIDKKMNKESKRK